MIRGIITATRGMQVLNKKQENISNNLANVDTPSFKIKDVVSGSTPAKTVVNNKNINKELGTLVLGTEIDQVYTKFSQGNLRETSNQTDLALWGDGFFTLQNADDEIIYTRDGRFKINNNNELVTQQGYNVIGIDSSGQTSNIVLNDDNYYINSEGKIIIEGIQSYQLSIVTFSDNQQLINQGGNIYSNSEMEPQLSLAQVKQGFVEESNVDPLEEMVKMIENSRQFESNQRVIYEINKTLEKSVNEVGRI